MELLIMIDSFLRASAYRITAVMPYFGYARQDRKDAGRVPITAKLVANIITRAGTDRVLAMDLHAAQLQGFFDVPVDHLYAAPVLNEHFNHQGYKREELVVVSADEGGIKRALGHANRLGAPLAVVDKRRTSAETTQAGKHHRRAGERQNRADVRRHDQHRQLDLRRRQSAQGKRRASKFTSPPRTACWWVRPSNGFRPPPIDTVVITDTIPLRPQQTLPKIKRPVRRRPLGPGHQAHSPQRIGQHVVRLNRRPDP